MQEVSDKKSYITNIEESRFTNYKTNKSNSKFDNNTSSNFKIKTNIQEPYLDEFLSKQNVEHLNHFNFCKKKKFEGNMQLNHKNMSEHFIKSFFNGKVNQDYHLNNLLSVNKESSQNFSIKDQPKTPNRTNKSTKNNFATEITTSMSFHKKTSRPFTNTKHIGYLTTRNKIYNKIQSTTFLKTDNTMSPDTLSIQNPFSKRKISTPDITNARPKYLIIPEKSFEKSMSILDKVHKKPYDTSNIKIHSNSSKNVRKKENGLRYKDLSRFSDTKKLELYEYQPKILNFIDYDKVYLIINCKNQTFPINLSCSSSNIAPKFYISFDDWPDMKKHHIYNNGHKFQIQIPEMLKLDVLHRNSKSPEVIRILVTCEILKKVSITLTFSAINIKPYKKVQIIDEDKLFSKVNKIVLKKQISDYYDTNHIGIKLKKILASRSCDHVVRNIDKAVNSTSENKKKIISKSLTKLNKNIEQASEKYHKIRIDRREQKITLSKKYDLLREDKMSKRKQA